MRRLIALLDAGLVLAVGLIGLVSVASFFFVAPAANATDEVAVLPQPEPSVMKVKLPCTRSVTVAAPDRGTVVRFVQSKRCGGPVGSFTATDDMSMVLLTQIPGQRPVTHRLRVEVVEAWTP